MLCLNMLYPVLFLKKKKKFSPPGRWYVFLVGQWIIFLIQFLTVWFFKVLVARGILRIVRVFSILFFFLPILCIVIVLVLIFKCIARGCTLFLNCLLMVLFSLQLISWAYKLVYKDYRRMFEEILMTDFSAHNYKQN